MDQKNTIAKKLKTLKEAKVMIKPEDFQDIAPELGDNDVVKIVDEQPEGVEEVNQEVLDKFIKQYGKEKGEQIYYATANKQDRNPENFHTENEEGQEQNVDVNALKHDVQKFMDRLNLGQFEGVLAKINTPMEQAEVIAAFAERIGVPRAKLPLIIKQIKVQAEGVRPKMKKSDLVENILRKKS